MKRDMDLCRKILEAVEQAPTSIGFVEIEIEGYSADEISYNVLLLQEAGLLTAIDITGMSSSVQEMKPERLTWEGHEFLEAARNETRWKRAKDIIQEKGGGAVFEVVKAVLIDLMKGKVT